MSRGQGLCAFERRRVAILVDQRQHLRAARRHPKPKGDARGFAGCDFHAVTQREHGIEDRARRVGQRPRLDDGHGIAQIMSAPQKPSPVGFELQTADGLALQCTDMSDPTLGLAGLSAAPSGQHCAALGDEFGLHEHLGEGGMSGIRIGCRQHDLGVSRQFDFTNAAAFVGHRDSADFRIVLGRHEDFGRSEDGSVPAGDLRAILEERHLIAIRLAPYGLISGRPYIAIGHVAQEHEAAPGVAGRILAPASHGDVPPTAVSGAGHGQHYGIISVRQQMSARRGLMRGAEQARFA